MCVVSISKGNHVYWSYNVWVYLHPSAELWSPWSFGPALAEEKKDLRERKFKNSVKTDGRERIYHFLQQNYCVTSWAADNPHLKNYFGYTDDGKAFSQTLRFMRHAITPAFKHGFCSSCNSSFCQGSSFKEYVPSCPSAVACESMWARPKFLRWGWFETPSCTCCQSHLPSLLPCSLSQTNSSLFREAAVPPSSLLSCFKAAAGFESWSLFAFLETLFFFFKFHAQAPVPVVSLLCSWQPVAVQSLIYRVQPWGGLHRAVFVSTNGRGG